MTFRVFISNVGPDKASRRKKEHGGKGGHEQRVGTSG